MQTPHPDIYPVIQKKNKVQRYQMRGKSESNWDVVKNRGRCGVTRFEDGSSMRALYILKTVYFPA
jgi:hypothetical protein